MTIADKRKERIRILEVTSLRIRPKCISMLLITLISLSMLMTTVGGSSTTKLYINPPKIERWIPAFGETFMINVTIANVTDLQSFEFKLYWNTTLLDLAQVQILPFLNWPWIAPIYEINETIGRFWINITSIEPPGASGSGPLMTLSFKIMHCGPFWPENATCALDLADTKLINSGGSLIPHEVQDSEYICYSTQLLSITAMTDKPLYGFNETVQVYGNLTFNFLPVQDEIVALQVDNPRGQIVVMRTLLTGNPPASQTIEIVSVIPCDQAGEPKNSFLRGTSAYFKVTLKNNDVQTHRVMATINLYDTENRPFGFTAKEGPVTAGATLPWLLAVPIPDTASFGGARVYASALIGWPMDGETAYCPEKSATFNITGGTGGPFPPLGSPGNGNYSLTFKLPLDPMVGVYRVYASASYQGLSTIDRMAFGINVICVPNHYSTIQGAVNAASPTNNSILVLPGTYDEHVTINKPLTLVGRDPTTTIIDGGGTGTVVTVTAGNVTVSRFKIRDGGNSVLDSGIDLKNSSCNISENMVLNNYYGIKIHSSDNNFVLNNIVSGNNYGIYLNHSTSNTLKGNSMICNKYNFGVFGNSVSDFTHTMGTSNTVNRKPVIYWVNRHDAEVPSDAGFVAIVCSTGIAVRAPDLTKNVQGVVFAFTNDSTIERVNTLDNEYGIYLVNSHRNIIIGSKASNNFVGIYLRNSNESNIYHNNFINNINQMERYQSLNTWDDGAGKGNYWSNYTGLDNGSGGRIAGDGVGDTLLPHQGVDWYPLMNPWILVYDIAITSVIYTVMPYNSSRVYPNPNWKVVVNVTVKNEGDSIETFDVSAHANTTIIQTQPVTLPVRSSTTISFTWNMDEYVPTGNYTIRATATQVLGETHTADNTYTDGIILVMSEPNPDVNGDGVVDIVDIVIVAMAYGSAAVDDPETPWDETENWNPVADLNGDQVVDIVDIVLVAIHFGEEV